jgi:hypothetical protein
VTTQTAEHTPPINTCMIIIKNKPYDVFAKKGKFEKTDVTTLIADHTPTINTLENTVMRNIKNTIKNEPWSALYSSATLGSQLPSSAHKDLPTPATIPLTR